MLLEYWTLWYDSRKMLRRCSSRSIHPNKCTDADRTIVDRLISRWITTPSASFSPYPPPSLVSPPSFPSNHSSSPYSRALLYRRPPSICIIGQESLVWIPNWFPLTLAHPIRLTTYFTKQQDEQYWRNRSYCNQKQLLSSFSSNDCSLNEQFHRLRTLC